MKALLARLLWSLFIHVPKFTTKAAAWWHLARLLWWLFLNVPKVAKAAAWWKGKVTAWWKGGEDGD